MNYILMNKNYPPLIISRKQRRQYLESMNSADKCIKTSLTETNSKCYRDLLVFICSEYEKSYWDIFLI